MQEQSFEKSVQQAMEPFSITPSGAVWEGVSAAIRPQRRRRRRVAPWLALLVGLCVAGWWVFDNAGKKNAAATSGTVATGNNATTNNADEPSKPVTEISDSRNDMQSSQPEINKQTDDKTAVEIVGTATPFSSKKNKIKKGSAFSAPVIIDKSAASEKIIPTKNEGNMKSGKSMDEGKKTDSFTIAQGAFDKRYAALKQIQLNASLAFFPNANNTVAGLTPTKPLFTEVYSLKAKAGSFTKRRPKANFSFGLQAGIAGLQQQRLPVFASVGRSFSNFSAPIANNSTQAGNINTVTKVSSLRPGRHIAAAAFWHKPFFKRITLLAGLQYSHYAQKQAVGSKLRYDNTLLAPQSGAIQSEALFTPGSNSDFVNSYHLVALPVMLQWHPLPRAPLRLQGGVAAGYVFAARSLQYDAASRVYYQSNNMLRKVQALFVSGADYRIATTKRHLIYAGPKMTYHLTRLRSGGGLNNGRLFQYGAGLLLEPK